jgi:RNA polymerase sigma-70 factor (ECF subfamily)
MPKPDQRSDEEITIAIRAGDRELYALIMDRYQEKLRRYAKTLVHDDDRAADVVQEALIKAYVNLQSFNAHKKFSSWVYRIVHNEAMNYRHRYRLETALPVEYDQVGENDVELDWARQEIVDRVEKCLAQMHVRYAEPLSLFYLEDKSYEEISDILHLPMGTVATRISRAKIIMKAICQKT